jgi:AraC family transcriptional regulator
MADAQTFPVPAFTRLRKHEHDSTHICVVLGGGFIERQTSGWRDVGPGTLRVSGAARHDIDFSSHGAECLVIESIDFTLRTPAPRFFDHEPRLEKIARAIHSAERQTDPESTILIEDLTCELLAQISRRIDGRPAHTPSWLSEIRDRIHDDRSFASVESLARDAQVHRVHLARAFHDHYGTSVTRYIRSVRARRALSLIISNAAGLSQIAARAGYSDQSHLTREIRTMTGKTPGALRSMLHPFKTA